MKPHIKKGYGFWYCAGAGHIAIGWTPAHAYFEWRKGVPA